jgi:hypothetical protein
MPRILREVAFVATQSQSSLKGEYKEDVVSYSFYMRSTILLGFFFWTNDGWFKMRMENHIKKGLRT